MAIYCDLWAILADGVVVVGGQVAKGPSGRRKDVILSRQERGQRRRASGRNSRQIVDADRRRGAGLKERVGHIQPLYSMIPPNDALLYSIALVCLPI